VSSDIQEIIRYLVLDGEMPTEREFTMNDIRQRYYGSDFDLDSGSQKGTISYHVRKVRKETIQDITSRTRNSLTFYPELLEIVENRMDEIDTSSISDVDKRYLDELISGDASDDIADRQVMLETDAIYTVWWKDRVIENAGNGRCLILPFTRGRGARWKLECNFHQFSIRDRGVAEHFWRSLSTALRRMRDTRQRLESGTPIQVVLERLTNVIAEIQDGTSWRCPNCGASNTSEQERCVLCRTERI